MPRTDPAKPTTRAEALKAQGRAIARARHAAGLSQSAAATQLGVVFGTFRNWEQGIRTAPPEIRARMVEEWGGDASELATVEGKCPCCGRPYE